MVFSLEKWNNGKEFQRVIKSSTAVDYNSFETVLREAFDLFIRPILGEEMTDRLIREYEENTPEKNNQLVYLAQRANANLAIWYNFYELTVILSDQEYRKQKQETTKVCTNTRNVNYGKTTRSKALMLLMICCHFWRDRQIIRNITSPLPGSAGKRQSFPEPTRLKSSFRSSEAG